MFMLIKNNLVQHSSASDETRVFPFTVPKQSRLTEYINVEDLDVVVNLNVGNYQGWKRFKCTSN